MGKFYGSDDGYDYSRDNRDGYVDEFLKSLERDEEMKRREKEEKKESKWEMGTLVLIVVKGKYKVYRETKYPNGYSRRLLATFKTSYNAERFMNSRP